MSVLQESWKPDCPLSRRFPFIGVISLALVVVGGFWFLHAPAVYNSKAVNPEPQRTMKVVATPLMSTLDAIGTIQAGSRIIVGAPFDGFVKERYQEVGAHVRLGDVLFEMDTSEIDGRLRDAEAAILRASMAAASLEKWASGSEVFRARSGLANAEAQLATLDQNEKQAKTLIDRGIISKNEYDGIVQQVQTQRNEVAAAQQNLDDTLDRGNENNRRLADLDLISAKARIDDLNAQRQENLVKAPRDGILMRLPASPGASHTDGVEAEDGVHVARAQALFAIANLDTLIAETTVDEIDVNQIHVGQAVMLESDSFPGDPIQGNVIAVGGEADEASSLGGSAHFVVKARFSVNEKRRPFVRIGMSVRLRVRTYDNPTAIIVPQEAVATLNGQYTVRMRDSASGQSKVEDVLPGVATPDGIEIRHGLSVGDVILLP